MMSRPVTAGPADIDAIMVVMAAAFHRGFGEAWSAVQVLGSLATDGAWARLTCDVAGAPIGFTLCRSLGTEVELLLIGVVPEARGAGVGRALVAAAAADARARGANTIFLEVRDGNAAALALYRAAGYAVVGRRRDYYRGAGGGRYDAITLRLTFDDC